jgi:hypothetical protein
VALFFGDFMISIDFSFESQYGLYSDALILEDNHTFTDQEIENMKQQRFNNYLNLFIEVPVVEVIE